MRLGDLGQLYDAVSDNWCGSDVASVSDILDFIKDSPTIDPETLPIVQELRKELERVKVERDAAIKSRAKLAEYELTACEEFCYGDAQHDIPPCEWLVDGKCALREWVKTND